MIFTFDKSLRTDDDKVKQKLARCLILINEKGHRIDRNGFYFSFIEDNILVTTYMGSMDIAHIKSNHELFNVASSQRQDYRCITIGCGEKMQTLENAYLILNEPSLIIVENGTNDSSVITRWAECYKGEGNIGDINATICDAFEDNRVRFLGAGGGSGTIRKRIEDQYKVYGNCSQLKIMSVFDSDKTSIDDDVDHQKSLKDFLVDSNFEYHCLIKREMENYFPISVYEKCGLLVQGKKIPSYKDIEWDYVKIKEEKDKKPGEQDYLIYEKKYLPDLAANAMKEDFQQRILHQPKYPTHYGEVDEIQYILFKIAMFV